MLAKVYPVAGNLTRMGWISRRSPARIENE
jgi:hypothetical protein